MVTQHTKSQKLNVLRELLERDAKGLRLAGEPNLVVPPEGSPDAEVMFVGEAAGFHELQERRPFVGVAGKLLTKTLEEHGMKRKDVWISNMVKARPPENRDPLPEELEAYRPYLDAEIAILKPKIVVTLGRFSMGKFLGPDVRISQAHGQARWVNFIPASGSLLKGRVPRTGDDLPASRCPAVAGLQAGRQDPPLRFVVLPMYHPAAALRSGAVMTAFLQDFKKLPVILQKLSGEDDKIETVLVHHAREPEEKQAEQLSFI